MKRIIALLLSITLILAIALTGCGQKEKTKEQPNQEDVQNNTNDETTNTDEDTNEDAGADEDVSLQYILDKGEFILGLDATFAPMGFRDEETNEIVGFDVDLANEVTSRMGVELKLQPIDWDSKVMNLSNKDIDCIWNGLTITEERKKNIEFSRPYIDNRQVMIVTADSDIDTKEDLVDKVVGVQLDSSGQTAVEDDQETVNILKDLQKYSTYTDALMDLSAGRIDVVVIDEIMGRYYIAKKPDQFKVASEDFGKEEYGIGFRKGDVALRDEVNRILNEMIEDGTAAQISEKWFGEDIIKK